MTIAELLLTTCILIGLMALLRPFKNFLERRLLSFFGSKDPRIIDVSVIREKKNNSPKE